jgi:demethylmacrocin O-methyltransferase
MPSAAKSAAARWIKPVVPENVWERLRRLGGAEPVTLTALAQETGTDKWGRHYYTPHYQRHLEHLRDQKIVVLEIGIGGYAHTGKGGQSLRMWKHFFPHAQIIGLDIHDKSFVEEERITTYQGSQVDPAVLERIVADHGRPHVVIDDGSHRPEHIRETFRLLFPLLVDDGVYAIEDTQTSYWPFWGGSMDRQDPTTTMALVKDLIDGLNHEEFLDRGYQPTYSDTHVTGVSAYHNLVFVQKGRNREGSWRHDLEQKRTYRRMRRQTRRAARAAEAAATDG